MKYINFTEEEKLRANEVSLIDYLHSRGEKLKNVGSSCFVESLNGVSIYKNKWYDHYNKKGGVAVGFLKEFYGFSYVDAVVELLGEENIEALRIGGQRPSSTNYNTQPKAIKQNTNLQKDNEAEIKKPFILPKKARNNDKLIDYLCNKRFIDKDVVNIFIKAGTLFQSEDKNNVVFVGNDENGVPAFACLKGTYVSEKGTFTQTLTSSNCDYGFSYKNDNEVLCVFEAPIDMLSFMTLLKDSWEQFDYLALDGVSEKSLLKYLEQNKNIKKVQLCLDNDAGGFEATERIVDILKEHDFNEIEIYKTHTKDMNEELKELNGLEGKPSVKHPKYEAYVQRVDELLFFCAESSKATEESVVLKYSDFVSNYRNRYFEFNQELLDKLTVDTVSVMKKHLKQINRDVPEDTILKQLLKDYRTYKDKGHLNTKMKELNEFMKEFNSYKEKLSLTETEKVGFIKNMINIANMSIRVNIELEQLHLKEVAKQSEQLKIDLEQEDTNVNFNEQQLLMS